MFTYSHLTSYRPEILPKDYLANIGNVTLQQCLAALMLELQRGSMTDLLHHFAGHLGAGVLRALLAPRDMAIASGFPQYSSDQQPLQLGGSCV